MYKSEFTSTDLQNQNQLQLSYYYNKLNTVPMRGDERTSSLIDNIYTNIPESDADMSGVLISVIISQYSMFTNTLIG